MMKQLHKIILIGLLFTLATVTAGCGRYAVRPDEKEYLADRIMQSGFDTQESALDEHVLDNREGSAGGNGASGGGCGCN